MQGKCADKESKIKKETPGMNFLSAQEYGLFDLARMTHEFCFMWIRGDESCRCRPFKTTARLLQMTIII